MRSARTVSRDDVQSQRRECTGHGVVVADHAKHFAWEPASLASRAPFAGNGISAWAALSAPPRTSLYSSYDGDPAGAGVRRGSAVN